MKAKNWKPGVADEIWKIMICARDAERADDVIGGITYILGVTQEELRQMTGAQILDGLLAYKRSAYDSVEAGLLAPRAASNPP